MEKAVDLGKAVAAFGGYSGLARRLQVPLSTCHGWKRRDKLPSWRARQIAVLAKAARKDVFKDVPLPKPARGARRKRVQ